MTPKFTRRDVLYGLGAATAFSMFAGCGVNSRDPQYPSSPSTPTPPTPPSNPQPVPSGPTVSANVTVYSTVIGSIAPGFCGLSYEKSQMALPFFSGQNTNAIALFKLLGNSVLRIGGISVDNMQWTPDGPGQKAGQIAPADIDALADFLAATGWSVIYGINLAQSTPELAAAEMAYATQKLGSSLISFHLGDGPDAYGAEYPNLGSWDPTAFVNLWQTFAQASAGSSFVGPELASPQVDPWTTTFAASESKLLKQLTQHYYRGNGLDASSTMDELLAPDSILTTLLGQLGKIAAQYNLPFRFTESNTFYNGGAVGVSNAYGAALWTVDYLFQLATGGASGANIHGGGDTSYAPITDFKGRVTGISPQFYGLLLFVLAGNGQLRKTTISAGGVNATAYAVATSSQLNVIIINKDATQNLQVTLDAGQAVSSANLLMMTGDSLSATTGGAIQGASVGADYSFTAGTPYGLQVSGNDAMAYVTAGSAALIQIPL